MEAFAGEETIGEDALVSCLDLLVESILDTFG